MNISTVQTKYIFDNILKSQPLRGTISNKCNPPILFTFGLLVYVLYFTTYYYVNLYIIYENKNERSNLPRSENVNKTFPLEYIIYQRCF